MDKESTGCKIEGFYCLSFNIFVLSAHASTERKSDDSNDSFY